MHFYINRINLCSSNGDYMIEHESAGPWKLTWNQYSDVRGVVIGSFDSEYDAKRAAERHAARRLDELCAILK